MTTNTLCHCSRWSIILKYTDYQISTLIVTFFMYSHTYTLRYLYWVKEQSYMVNSSLVRYIQLHDSSTSTHGNTAFCCPSLKYSLYIYLCTFAARYYANVEEKKQLQIMTLGDKSDNVQLYTWLLIEHNKIYEYDDMKWEPYCWRCDITVIITT